MQSYQIAFTQVNHTPNNTGVNIATILLNTEFNAITQYAVRTVVD